MSTTLKTCARCRTDKPVSEFSVRSTAPDRLAYWCRGCFAAAYRARAVRNETARTHQQPAPAKTCCRCKQTLPADAFNRHRGMPDGLQTHCRACSASYSRDRHDAPTTSRSA